MKVKSIIARFLPLLDVAIVLLGLLIVLMTYAHFETQSTATTNTNPSATQGSQGIVKQHFEFILLHAQPDGKCCLIESGTDVHPEIDTESDHEIRAILDKKSPEKVKLLLLTSKPGEIDTLWPQNRIDQLKKTWKLKDNEILCRLTSVSL